MDAFIFSKLKNKSLYSLYNYLQNTHFFFKISNIKLKKCIRFKKLEDFVFDTEIILEHRNGPMIKLTEKLIAISCGSTAEHCKIFIWDLSKGRCIKTLSVVDKHPYLNHDSSLSIKSMLKLDNKTIIGFINNIHRFNIWDFIKGTIIASFDIGNEASYLEKLNENQVIFLENSSLSIFDLKQEKVIKKLSDKHPIECVEILNSYQIVTSTYESISIWNLHDYTISFNLFTGFIPRFLIKINGSKLLISGNYDDFYIFDYLKSEIVNTITVVEEKCKDCIIKIDQTKVAIGFNRGLVEVWDIIEGVCLNIFKGYIDTNFFMIKLNPFQIASAGNDKKTIRIMNLY